MRVLNTWNRSTSAWPLADQAVVSLGTFLTNVTLARVLPVREYGTFAFLLDLLFLLVSLHAALVTYAVSVRGATSDRAGLCCLSGGALAGTVILAIPLVGAMATAALLVEAPHVSPWAASALVLWIAQETVRRALMAHLRHRAALAGDAISYFGQAALVWSFGASLTLTGVFAIMALTSAAAMVLQVVQLGLQPAHLRVHWRTVWTLFAFGRWALLVALTSIFTVQAFTWALVYFHGTVPLAGFQSIANLVRVSHPVMFSTANVLVPAVAGAGAAAAFRVTVRHSLHGAVLLLPYLAILILFPASMLRLLYGAGSPYVEYAGVLRLLAAGYVLLFISEIASALLRGLERSRQTFIAEAWRSAVVLVIALPLVASYGVLGACWGGLIAVAVRLTVLAVFIRRSTSHDAIHARDDVLVSRDGVSPA